MVSGRWVAAAAAATCLVAPPTAIADRQVSVGYRTAAALRGLHVVRQVPALHTAHVRLRDDAAIRTLRARPGIRFVERTRARASTSAPALPLVPAWQLAATRVDAVPPWVLAAASTITVAVVDTGADLTTPALSGRHAVTFDVATGASTVTDVVGHGTFVTSLAAGFSGDAQLMVVRANRGGTSFDDVDEASAIVWAVDHGARIVNLSIGGLQTSRTERDAITYATDRGVLLVAAAGNAAEAGNPAVYPAALIGRSGLVVGAATQAGTRASFSSTGTHVDLLAPGVDVLGAIPAGYTGTLLSPLADGTYGVGSGTSYASPEVAGAAALVWAANPLLDASGVADTIDATASGHGVWTKQRGWGNLDVAAAVGQATSGVAPRLVQPKPLAAKPTKLPAKRT